MSQENVERARAGYEYLSRVGEPNRELLDPEVTFDATSLPGFGSYRSLDAFLADWRPYRDTFDEWRIEVEELVEGRGGRVFVSIRDGGQIKGSDREVFQRAFHVQEFRACKVVRFQLFLDRSEAVEAAGLRE